MKELFKEMLKMQRRVMSPNSRARTTMGNIIWLYPYAQERQYYQYLKNLMNIYSEMTIPALKNNLQRWIEEQRSDRQDDFQTEFSQLINKLEKTQYNMFDENGEGEGEFNNAAIIGTLSIAGFAVSNFNDKQSQKFTKKILGQPFYPEERWMPVLVNTWSNANFSLIKSLSNEYIKKLNFIVSDGVMSGKTWNAMMKDVRGMSKNITKTRAKLLTRDQIGKLNGNLTKRRQEEIGIDMYKWMSSRDERVRASHKKLDGKICRWDNNELYADSIADAKSGRWKSRSAAGMEIGTPGSAIQCRCVGIPMFSNVIENADREVVNETS